LNPIGLAQMAWVADKPGTLLGIHPEGSRGKGADPHFIQVARPGVGELVKRCHPDMLILPFFIGGLTNDFAYHVGCNIRGEIGDGMRYNFGPPVRAGDFDRNQDAQILADEILDLVRELRDVDRGRLGMPPWVEPDA
jgi:1-acyl-sn-glycerol-3-phosphate acyltransferase